MSSLYQTNLYNYVSQIKVLPQVLDLLQVTYKTFRKAAAANRKVLVKRIFGVLTKRFNNVI